jgi:uncharacterized membrane protein
MFDLFDLLDFIKLDLFLVVRLIWILPTSSPQNRISKANPSPPKKLQARFLKSLQLFLRTNDFYFHFLYRKQLKWPKMTP